MPGEGSRSTMRRSGLRSSSMRESQMCGVTTFWLARNTSVAAFSTTTWVFVPSFLGTCAVWTQSGKWAGVFLTKNPRRSVPPGNTSSARGRPRTWGSMASPTRS